MALSAFGDSATTFASNRTLAPLPSAVTGLALAAIFLPIFTEAPFGSLSADL
jgi:hypothetical protein